MRLFWMSIVLPMLLTGTCARGQKSSNSSVPRTVEKSHNLKCYYGVIGHVRKQSVFEFLTPCANLAELIERAGGLSKSASGHLKIVHSDGTETQAFYSPHSREKLLPNDLLSVEGVSDNIGHEEHANRIESRAETRIRIGLINLIDRPVVLVIRNDLAKLDRFLDYLNQSPELAKSLRIIQPAGSSSQKNETALRHLTEGSIVVFAPRSVKASSLPFHATYEPVAVLQALADNTKKTIRAIRSDTTASARSHTPNSELSDENSRRDDLRQASRSTGKDRITNNPPGWTVTAPASSQNPDDRIADPLFNNMADRNPQKRSRESEETASGRVAHAEENSSTREPSTAWNRKFSSPKFVTILSLLGSVMLFSSYLLWSIARKTTTTQRDNVATANERSHLKALIEDVIPMVTLEVQHPGNFKLFDNPSSEKFLRIDVSHRIRRPQFLPRESQPLEKKEVATSESIVQYDTVLPPEETVLPPEETVTVEPETEKVSTASGEEGHEVRAPHFLERKHTPLRFQPHLQQNDFVQRVLDRVHKEERQ